MKKQCGVINGKPLSALTQSDQRVRSQQRKAEEFSSYMAENLTCTFG